MGILCSQRAKFIFCYGIPPKRHWLINIVKYVYKVKVKVTWQTESLVYNRIYITNCFHVFEGKIRLRGQHFTDNTDSNGFLQR